MKVLITGVAGTGKSTISEALNEKGIYSIDFSDIPGLCFWRDKVTGDKVNYSPINDAEWFESKERICDKAKLKKIVDQYDDIVVTGIASGSQMEYLDLFDKVLLLQCNPETFIQRMAQREKSYGKTKTEQDMVVGWQKDLDPKLISRGAIPVNTEGNLEDVVAKVITLIS